MEEVYEYIEGFCVQGSQKGIVQLPRRIKINGNFVEGYALYIGEGDFGSNGEKVPKKVRFTNSNLNVIEFFIEWLRNHFPKTDFSCRVLVPQEMELNEEKLEAVKKKLDINKIDAHTSKRNKKLVYRVWADSIILMRLLLDLEETVKEESISSKELVKVYVRGIMMGEGTARLKDYYRYVRVEMKNKKEINFVGKLLNLLDIKYKSYSRSDSSGRYWIHIGERKDIEKFGKLIGFGVHSERQRILEKCIDSYKEEHFRKGERNQRFLEAVYKLTNEGKAATTETVSQLLNRSTTNAKHTLKSLYDKGHLERTRNSENYFEYKLTGKALNKINTY